MKLNTRADIIAAGYVPGWHGEPATVGDTCVVYARGGWRESTITKLTPTYVYADVITPTSPDLHTVGRGDRTGRVSDLYVRPPWVPGRVVCGNHHPRISKVCAEPPQHVGQHRADDGTPWGDWGWLKQHRLPAHVSGSLPDWCSGCVDD